jgi:hypothetical protein
MADVEHFKDRMERENYRFEITELGGDHGEERPHPAVDSVVRAGSHYLPPILNKTNYEGRTVDLINSFKNDEYLPFPVGTHDDMLDALARCLDDNLPVCWPAAYIHDDDEEELLDAGRNRTTGY